MSVQPRLCLFLVLAPVLVFGLCAPSTATEDETQYKNLQVLPNDIPRDELGGIMLGNLRGLGLRRLAGEGCLFCHDGDLEVPRSEWDYASDAKPMKKKARVMMAMVQTINSQYLAKLDGRVDESLEVTCTTCHSGRTDPRPLPDVLWTTYEEGGVEAAVTRYRELRERYFGGDAYDFRAHILPALALHITDQGQIDDGVRLNELNVEVYPDDTTAWQSWVALKLERTLGTEGVDAALVQLEKLAPSLPEAVVAPGLLDSLAWRLNRSDREAAGHALIEANYERFPESYRSLESHAFILADTGRKAEAFSLLEGWLEKNPDHSRARRLLVNLRSKSEK